MGYDAAVVEFAYIELLRRTNLQRVFGCAWFDFERAWRMSLVWNMNSKQNLPRDGRCYDHSRPA